MQVPVLVHRSARGLQTAIVALFGAVVLCLASCSDAGPTAVDAEFAPAPAGPNLSERLQDLSQLVTAEEIASAFRPYKRDGVLKRRETLIDVLDRMGADRSESNRAVYVAASHVDMRKLRPGQEVVAYFDDTTGAQTGGRLSALTMRTEPGRQVIATRTHSGDWVSRELAAELKETHGKVGGIITTSIYELARAQGAWDQQIVDFANIFAYDIDFQRQIREGDAFEITYQLFTDEKGHPIKGGEVLYAELDGKLAKRRFYRFTTTDDGVTDYYDQNGEAARKFLMKTPINGARLSSGFGARRHPVLGYTRMHKGTDFAAPRGTRIYAAGNGVVERASRYGSFGNYIRIRHANGYKTAYAHLSRYGAGIKAGKRVKQGQVIGYVGTTGRSTGPHLHYEVLVKGKQVNAMKLDLPTGRKLSGKMLEAFEAERSRIDDIRESLTQPSMLADRPDSGPA